MTDFIINTAQHKRWWLPCHCHQYNSVLYGDQFHCSILDGRSGETLASWYINIREDWENLSHLSQELANKNHPKPQGRLTNCRLVPASVQHSAKADYRRNKND